MGPALTSHLAKQHGIPRGLSHKFPLCPTHTSMILGRFIPEGYQEIPPDLFCFMGGKDHFSFPFGLQCNCVSSEMHFTAVQMCRAWTGLQRGHDCCVKGQRGFGGAAHHQPFGASFAEALFRTLPRNAAGKVSFSVLLIDAFLLNMGYSK